MGTQANIEELQVDNLALWKTVEETDKSFTKESTYGHKQTSISTQYMVMRATEQFGPMGMGWGTEVLSERLEDMGPLMVPANDGTKALVEVARARIHTLHMRLWYMRGGSKYNVEQFGHTQAVYKTNKGEIMVDENYAKKSFSDAMKKCLSLLGFSADIFLGYYDDHEYAQEAEMKARQRKEERQLEREDLSKAEVAEKKIEFAEWVSRAKDAYKGIKSPRGLQTLHKTNREHAQTHAPRLGIEVKDVIDALTGAYHDQLDKVTEPQDTVCTACGASKYQHIHRPCSEEGCGGKVEAA